MPIYLYSVTVYNECNIDENLLNCDRSWWLTRQSTISLLGTARDAVRPGMNGQSCFVKQFGIKICSILEMYIYHGLLHKWQGKISIIIQEKK